VTLLAPFSKRHFNIISNGLLRAGKVTFSGGRVTMSGADAYGGALRFVSGGSGVLSSCILTNNTVTVSSGFFTAGGGAIYLTDSGSLRLTSCRLSGNRAAAVQYARGGALCVMTGAALSLWRTIFSGNAIQASAMSSVP
jgi:hypothetical protein